MATAASAEHVVDICASRRPANPWFSARRSLVATVRPARSRLVTQPGQTTFAYGDLKPQPGAVAVANLTAPGRRPPPAGRRAGGLIRSTVPPSGGIAARRLVGYPGLQQLSAIEALARGKPPSGLSKIELNATLALLYGHSITSQAQIRGVSQKRSTTKEPQD